MSWMGTREQLRPEAGRKLFVGGIPAGIDQHVVKDDFIQFGEIEDVYLPADHDTGRLRGIAFVTFVRSEDAHEAAGAMHGRDYHGRKISCTMAKPKDKAEGGKGEGRPGWSSTSFKPGATYSYSRPRDYWDGFNERERFEQSMRRGDRDGPGSSGPERERDHHDDDAYPRARSDEFRGTERYGGQYGARDPRPVQSFYD